jgi:hypothetical protein
VLRDFYLLPAGFSGDPFSSAPCSFGTSLNRNQPTVKLTAFMNGMTSANPDYTVKFNREIARTLIYEDSRGSLLFVFDAGSEPKSISLGRVPLEDKRIVALKDEATRARITLALQRTKAYLVGIGYVVTED